MFTKPAAIGTLVYPHRVRGSTNTFKNIYGVRLETESVPLHDFGWQAYFRKYDFCMIALHVEIFLTDSTDSNEVTAMGAGA